MDYSIILSDGRGVAFLLENDGRDEERKICIKELFELGILLKKSELIIEKSYNQTPITLAEHRRLEDKYYDLRDKYIKTNYL